MVFAAWLTRWSHGATVLNALGNYGVCQPQILPLLGGRSVAEVIAVMLGEARDRRFKDRSPHVQTRSLVESLSERQWRQLLHDGYAKELVA